MASNDQTKIKPLARMKAMPEIPNATKHGLYTLKRAVARLGNRVINKRYSTGRALNKWRKDLERDLGGDVSIQQAAIVDLATKQKFLLDSIDVWMFAQKSLINKRKRSLLPVVRERQILADGLAKYLGMLGLARVIKTKSLEEILSEDEDK